VSEGYACVTRVCCSSCYLNEDWTEGENEKERVGKEAEITLLLADIYINSGI
jgi:hypothetical protein